MRKWLGLGIVGLWSISACDDGVAIDPLVFSLDVEPSVDFGDVPVGQIGSRTITVRNTGQSSFTVTSLEPGPGFSAPSHTFTAAPSGFTVVPGGSQVVGVSFQAFQVMADPVTSSFTVRTDAVNGDRPVQATIAVTGRGVPNPLRVRPDPLDFGTVLIGSSRTLPLTLTNDGPAPLRLTTRLAGGRAAVDLDQGDGRFEVLATPAEDGALLPGDGLLPPGQAVTVELRYTPEASGPGGEDQAHWEVASCTNPFCTLAARLIGRGTRAGLECRPAAVDFGGVNPGGVARQEVTCTNVASDPLELIDWALDPNSSLSYSALPFSPTTLEPGADVAIAVEFAPTLADQAAALPIEGELVVRAQNATNGDGVTPVRIALTGVAGGPSIEVAPARLDYGQLQIGTTDRRRLLVNNRGSRELLVQRVEVDLPELSAPPGPITLSPGTSTVVTVRLAPSGVGPLSGQVVFTSNDGQAPRVSVPVTAQGIDLGRCVHRVSPANLNFGIVELGRSAVASVQLENLGFDPCVVQRLAAVSTGSSTLAFSVMNSQDSYLLPPGSVTVIPVAFTPLRPGQVRGELSYYVSDPQGSDVTVPLFGVGLGVTDIECPPDVVTDAGRPVSLTVAARSQTGTVSTLRWEVLTAPLGGSNTPGQWAPDPPNQATELFWPRLVGVYTVEATITDGLGESARCTTLVTALGHGLRVELNWDGLGDVDLHLHNGAMTPWFGQGGNADDCFYANCAESSQPAGPIWDPLSLPYEGGNPALDLDNIVGFGPENIRVDSVAAGDTFTIGLHYFWDHGHGPRTSTINVYCGRVAAPTATYTSTAMVGLDQGGCTQNDFWKVATVTFTSTNSCAITTLDSYGPGSDRCAAF